MSKECVFCSQTRQSQRTVLKTSLVTAFLSNPRLMRGHLLIVPNRHVERLDQLSPEERHALIDTAASLQSIICNQLAQGCDFRIHFRPFQKEDGIKVNHLHAHLQPRELFDDLYQQSQKFETSIYKPLSDHERNRLINLFIEFLAANVSNNKLG
ncbi:MAG: HIT domain-containing protein [Patescibacteria group bacterium]